MWSPCRSAVRFLLLLWAVSTLPEFWCTRAELRTIDDTYGDSVTGAKPVYSSGGKDCWNQGPGCTACVLQPDPSKAYNGTWHETTSNMCDNAESDQSSTGHSVSFNFTGMTTIVVDERHVTDRLTTIVVGIRNVAGHLLYPCILRTVIAANKLIRQP